MPQHTPIRDATGSIVGMQTKGQQDAVQITVDEALKAVGVQPEPPAAPTAPRRKLLLPLLPTLRTELTAAVIVIVSLASLLYSGRSEAPSRAVLSTPQPTQPPTATVEPTAQLESSADEIILSSLALYGDYDETARLGQAPAGLTCSIEGKSPDTLWLFFTCPAPTGRVWAKVADVKLSEAQQKWVRAAHIVSHVAPTASALSSQQAQPAGSSLEFCTDKGSTWGKTHQCASTQAAADALADSEIRRINATAEAIQRGTK